MKKLVSFFLLLFVAFGLSACDNNTNNNDNSSGGNTNNSNDNDNSSGGNTNNSNNNGNSNSGTGDTIVSLNKPDGLALDKQTGVLSWNKVTNASSYIVSADGNEFSVEGNSVYLPVNNETTNIKVKAKSSNVESEWSQEFSYTVTNEDEFNSLKLFILSELKTNTELLEIVSYNMSPTLFRIICKAKIEGEIRLIRLAYGVSIDINNRSIPNVISAINENTESSYEIYEIVEYDTVKKIDESNLWGHLNNWKENGSTVEYLNSYTTKYTLKDEEARYNAYAIFKLTENDRVSYYSLNHAITTEPGDGSLAYVENLATAKISSSYSMVSEDVVEKIIYEAENEITAMGKNSE